MVKIMSYEEFEKKFKDSTSELNEIEQSRKDRILKILNQRTSETSEYGERHVKRELSMMDLHMEEILIIEQLSELNLIEGKPTNAVYQNYKKACLQGGLKPMNQIHFSRFIVKYFDYKILDKKIKGKKHRIFSRSINAIKVERPKKLYEEWWK